MPKNKRTNEEWRALLVEQRASGQSQAEWCTANGINLYTLRDRASRLKKLDRELEPAYEQPETGSAGWMDVTPERLPAKQAAGISISRDGWMVTVETGFDAEQLTGVLRAVSLVCC
jgi:hypothetical protein